MKTLSRKAKAKCQKETKAGRRKHKVALPWCVHISDGKKVLIRNRHCMCPSGWRNRDKCLSPNVDHTLPCSFNDPYNSTDSDRHTDSDFTVELNCSNKQVRLVFKTILFFDLNDPWIQRSKNWKIVLLDDRRIERSSKFNDHESGNI